MHKSGFVNILGRPNAGKSTLMNALVGERMSIITSKPQTTRHRIIGILSGEDFQFVFSDTPGHIKDPNYGMQKAMNKFIYSSFDDADLILLVIDLKDKYEEEDAFIEVVKKQPVPKIIVLNKMDLMKEGEIEEAKTYWKERTGAEHVVAISALNSTNTDALLSTITDILPEGPAYYPKDQLTDKPERFFVSEIIREKILEQYKQEIPYSVEIGIESYKETKTNAGEDLIRISTLIYVDRKSQKPILIGHKGERIKKLGTEARKSIEAFLQTKVFLEMHIKVKDGWRDNDQLLKNFGYQD
jgi:GTP-binding protein Era